MTNTCKSCAFWKNKQRDLNYSSTYGFCLHHSNMFNTQHGRIVGVIDMQNKKDRVKVSGNCSHDFEALGLQLGPGKLVTARYLLTVDETFGCIRHEAEDHFYKD